MPITGTVAPSAGAPRREAADGAVRAGIGDGAPPREGRSWKRRPAPVGGVLIWLLAVAWVGMTLVTAHAVAAV
jgi:hypothetical protein